MLSNIDLAVSPEIKEEIINLVGGRDPQGNYNLGFARLTAYLINHPCIDKETGMAIVTFETIRQCAKQRISNTGDWLKDFSKATNCTIHNHSFIHTKSKENKARRITINFLGDLINLKWKQLDHNSRLNWVMVDSDSPFIPTIQNDTLHTPDQREVRKYIKEVPKELYYASNKEIQEVKSLIDNHFTNNQEQYRRYLTGAVLQPPHYRASKKGNTCRLFDNFWSLLPKKARKTLMPTMHELDLVSAHLAIFEHICNTRDISTPTISKALNSYNPWEYLLSVILKDARKGLCDINIDYISNEHKQIKKEYKLFLKELKSKNSSLLSKRERPLGETTPIFPDKSDSLFADLLVILKRVVYGELYSESRNNVLRYMLNECCGSTGEYLDPNLVLAIHCSPVIHEIHNTQQKLLNVIRDKEGMFDSNGIWVEYRSERTSLLPVRYPNQVLSKVCSSYELSLLLPLLQVSKEHPGAFVTLWQHDGVAVACTDNVNLQEYVSACITAVNKQAKKLKIKTKLVHKP